VRNHVNVQLLTRWEDRYGAEAMIALSNFHSRSVFSENLVAIEMRKLEVKFNERLFESSMRNAIRGVSKSVDFGVDFCTRYFMFSGDIAARSMLLLSCHILDMGVNFFRIKYAAIVRSQRKLSPVRDSTFRLLGNFISGVRGA